MMVNNSNQIRDQILKLDPNLHAALTRKQTVNLNKDLNKSKNDDSAREIECISELSSDQTESFIDASPMPSAMERSRKNSINISTFRRNEELGKIEEKNEESYIEVEEREIPFNTKDSPAKQKPTTLLKETNSTPYKLQPFLEAKCAPDTTKRFFQTEKKSEIRITRKSKIGLTPPQPSESLLLRQRRLTNTFGQKHTTKNLLKGRKINELLDIDRYMQIRKFDKGIRRIRPSNSFIPMPEKEVYSFDRGKFNLPNFDKKKPQKHNTSHSQTKSHKKMMKSIKGFKQRIHEYGMNAKTLK